jgi:hypothetical protein
MKNTISIGIIFVASILILTACGKTGEQKIQPDAAPDKHYVKPEKERPQAFPIMLAPTEPCSIDAVGEQAAIDINLVTDKTKLRLAGWAGNVADGISPKEVWVQLVGTETFFIKADSGLKRSDVVSALNKPGLVDSGWEIFANLSALTVGTYVVSIVMNDGKTYLVCNTKRVIQLK